MKPIHCLIIVAMTGILLSGDAVAQNTPQYGRGRLLRKWRNDLFGSNQQQKQPKKADPRKQPTPAKNSAQAATPKQAAYGKQTNRPSQQRYQAPTNRKSAAAPKTRAPKSNGFGMQIQADSKDNFVVVRVDNGGNAAKAGIQRGDLVTQLGGADINSVDEITEIVKVLGEGDEIEMQISRRGQKKKVNVQYGEFKAPPAEEIKVSETDMKNGVKVKLSSAPAQSNSQYRSVLEGSVKQHQLARPTNTSSNPRRSR